MSRSTVVRAGIVIVLLAAGGGAASVTAQGGAARADTRGAAPVVVTIGDSIMNGHGVDEAQSWPALLAERDGWDVTDLATDGSGFLSEGDDGTTFQAQVDAAAVLNPSLVIISASSNDLDEDSDAVAAATEDTMLSLRTDLPDTRIIALSAIWADTVPPAELAQINEDLETSAALVGARYLDLGEPLADKPWAMQVDDVHPTADGLSILADRIDDAINDRQAQDAPWLRAAQLGPLEHQRIPSS